MGSEFAKWGGVLYSSQWTGWVPGNCGYGKLQDSAFAVMKLKVKGKVVQGPEPRRCGAGPVPMPPMPAPKPNGPVEYCPDPAKDFQQEDGTPAALTWTSSGWKIHGKGRVSSKASFDTRGGFIEFDMDLGEAQGNVNTNFYLTYPHKKNCGVDCYCDSGPTGGCAEMDLTENNGHCFQQTTWHTDTWGNNKAGGNWKKSHIGPNLHVHADFSPDGNTVWDHVGGNTWQGPGMGSEFQKWGGVLYSSQWTGWVPGNCGWGSLDASKFEVKNLKVKGKVVQGPEPRRCAATTAGPAPPLPPPQPRPTGSATSIEDPAKNSTAAWLSTILV